MPFLVLVNFYKMSIFQRFPELPRPNETAFCKINEVYCCGNVRYGNVSEFTNSVRRLNEILVDKYLFLIYKINMFYISDK